jgi:glycosyltransferase involved in cell wall biosynthesis
MAPPVVFDLTRFTTRFLNKSPNGIDRVDFAYANHFLRRNEANSGCVLTLLGPRRIGPDASRAALDNVAEGWGERDDPDRDTAYRRVVANLMGEPAAAIGRNRITRRRSGQARLGWRWLRDHGLRVGTPLARVPEGACYLNVSQFPVWISPYFGWLRKRPDVKAVFFIHDLLAIERPEFFPPSEYARHKKRLANFAAFGTAAITTSTTVRDSVTRHLAGLGRRDVPVLALPFPVTPVFLEPAPSALDLGARPYFICCSTIEPRKNHLMLLHVWHALVERYGAEAPTLILVGKRGWENENAVDMLERSIALRQRVIEVSGLSSPALRNLLHGARALLMPSFAEGYGSPVVEALAVGTPVVASDIPAFREFESERITRLSPIAGDRWLDVIAGLAFSMPVQGEPARRPDPTLISSERYFAEVDAFIASL